MDEGWPGDVIAALVQALTRAAAGTRDDEHVADFALALSDAWYDLAGYRIELVSPRSVPY